LIIGAGPAGCSAALTLRRRNASVTLLSAAPSALDRAKQIDNYPGAAAVSGHDLQQIMTKQVLDAGAEIKSGSARLIQKRRKGFDVLVGEDILSAKTILLACGTARKASIKGEEALIGAGVSYCATCDGMLYRGGRVAVCAEDESAAEDTAFLQKICETHYYAMKPHTLPQGVTDEGIPVSLAADEEGRVVLETAEDSSVFDCVFILRPSLPPSMLLPGLKLEGEAVWTDEKLMTSVPGVFAAGDIIGTPFQAARAVGQGNTAALSMAGYLHELEKNA